MGSTNFTSILLISPSQSNHQEAVTDFLEQQQLLDQEQLDTNLLWFNQENEGLKIKTVREIIAEGSFTSYQGKTRVIVLLHADNSSLPAQNALLKILEEPPNNTLIILTTSQPEQLLPTICSRCINVYPPEKQSAKDQDIAFHSPEVIQLAQQLTNPSFSHSQAIELANEYKDRQEALELSAKIIAYLHQQLQDAKTSNQVRLRQRLAIEKLLAVYSDLGKNLNPQLTLEHHLFQLIG